MRTRRLRFQLVVAAFVLVATVSGGFASAVAEEEPEVPEVPESGGGSPPPEVVLGSNYQNYMTWNLCQSACIGDHASRWTPTNQYAARITNSNKKPRGVAVQEICASGFGRLLGAVNQLGYGGAFVATKSTEDCQGSVGIAIIWKGGDWNGTHATYDQYGWQDGADGDTRKWICGWSGEYEATYCSTHLTNESLGIAWRQMRDYRLMSTNARNYFGNVNVFMGDLNIDVEEDNVGVDNWYTTNQHLEGDGCERENGGNGDGDRQSGCYRTSKVTTSPATTASSSLHSKFDYIFATRGQNYCLRQGTDVGWFGDVDYSDHAALRGYITCPTPNP